MVFIGTAVGGWIGGYVGDRAALWSPHHGRILICQLSVFAGVPLSLIILKVGKFVVASACRERSLCQDLPWPMVRDTVATCLPGATILPAVYMHHTLWIQEYLWPSCHAVVKMHLCREDVACKTKWDPVQASESFAEECLAPKLPWGIGLEDLANN